MHTRFVSFGKELQHVHDLLPQWVQNESTDISAKQLHTAIFRKSVLFMCSYVQLFGHLPRSHTSHCKGLSKPFVWALLVFHPCPCGILLHELRLALAESFMGMKAKRLKEPHGHLAERNESNKTLFPLLIRCKWNLDTTQDFSSIACFLLGEVDLSRPTMYNYKTWFGSKVYLKKLRDGMSWVD